MLLIAAVVVRKEAKEAVGQCIVSAL